MTDQKKAGVVLSYISQGVLAVSTLIYTPVMLRLLGQSEYGLYQLVYSVVAYLGLLSFGFSSSYIRYYSRFKAKNQDAEIAGLNGMFMLIFLVISGICLICGGIMILNIKGIFAAGLTVTEYKTARRLMVLMVFNLAVTFPNSVFECFTMAQERFLFQRMLIFLQNLLNPFLTLPLLLLGYGSIGMVLITTILTIGRFAANIWFCLFKLHIKFNFHRFQISFLKEIWIFTFFIFLNQMIDQANWNVDKFLLGRLSGTGAVAIYGLGGQINTMYVQLSSSVSSVFIPKVNRIVAESDDSKELTKLFTKIGRIQFVILGLVLSGFIFLGKPFMTFWGGKEYIQSYYVALFLIIPVTVPLIQNLGLEIQRAKNMHKTRSIVYSVIAAANILISIPMIQWIGPIGAAIGTAVALCAGNIIFMNWYYHKRIKIDIIYFWKSILSFLPAFLMPCATGILILLFVKIEHIVQLGAAVVLYAGIYSISMWKWGLNREEKQLLLSVRPGRKSRKTKGTGRESQVDAD